MLVEIFSHSDDEIYEMVIDNSILNETLIPSDLSITQGLQNIADDNYTLYDSETGPQSFEQYHNEPGILLAKFHVTIHSEIAPTLLTNYPELFI